MIDEQEKRYQDNLKQAYTDEVIRNVAHRTCNVYKHLGDGDGPTYTFTDHTLRDFVRQLVNGGVL